MEEILDKETERENLINLIENGDFNHCKNPVAIDIHFKDDSLIYKNCKGCIADSGKGCKIYELNIPISIFMGETNYFYYDPQLRELKIN